MSRISRLALFGKLNPTLHKSIESATVFAKLRGNPQVELAHWLHQLLQIDESDFCRILRHFGVDGGRLAADILGGLEALPGGATSIDDLSADIDLAAERAWVCASLGCGARSVRSAHLLVALLGDEQLRRTMLGLSAAFGGIVLADLERALPELVQAGPESDDPIATMAPESGVPGEASGAMAPAALGKREALTRFTLDLTEKARNGELDQVTGRDDEIRQIVDILIRRRQNNPILTGEAGVGKTAVVEGFAQRLADGDVPPQLKDFELRVLDVGLLQAGASMKGEFEQRLKQLIEEVQHAERPVILFIDEVHTLVGAGGAAGTGDAANLLKPALARGALRTIGATTWSEYKKYIEKDPALTRRFQVVQIDEPDEDAAAVMLRAVVPALEQHHGVRILHGAVLAAVSLSHRYIPARQLPDKAVGLLDTAAARVAVSLHTTPAALEDCTRQIQALELELAALMREVCVGIAHEERSRELELKVAAMRETERQLAQRWQEERALVASIVAIRDRLTGNTGSQGETEGSDGVAVEIPERDPAGVEAAPIDGEELLEKLSAAERALSALRGEDGLVYAAVDEQVVAGVVADWTGIPVGRMVRDEVRTVLELADHLESRVIGQRFGLDTISRRIQTARARLDDPAKPIGVFMLCGPSGVGKTETALALAEFLYGGEQNLITINMSEFQEAHTVSTLKGSPPGYVGYGEGGVLTEAVRRRPYSVILLDEVEKAHSDVHEIFFQVFDKGRMEDGEGRQIDFRNTVIILTSNVGTDLISSLCADPELMPGPEQLARALRAPLLEVFPPALLGRLIVVPYQPLSGATLASIVRLQLERIRKRLLESLGATFDFDQAAMDQIISRCDTSESGGRMIDAILTHSVLPEISRQYLVGLLHGQTLRRVTVSAEAGEFTYRFDMASPDEAGSVAVDDVARFEARASSDQTGPGVQAALAG